MCLSCGCKSPFDPHGDPANITLAQLAAAADAAGITVWQAAANLRDTLPVPGPLPRLFCDIDGTLSFEPEGDVLSVNAKFGASYVAADVDWYPFSAKLPDAQAAWLGKFWPHIAVNLAPDSLAADVLRRAVGHGYPLTVCTERGSKLAAVTRWWVRFWKIPADQVAVVEHGGKLALLEPYGPDDPAILIDDSPANASLARAGVQVWQPARPYNSGGDGVFRFADWNAAAAALGLT